MTRLLSLNLTVSLSGSEWETDLREGIQLSDFNATLEQFREDRRHLRDPALSIILLCYLLVLVLAGGMALRLKSNPKNSFGFRRNIEQDNNLEGRTKDFWKCWREENLIFKEKRDARQALLLLIVSKFVENKLGKLLLMLV